MASVNCYSLKHNNKNVKKNVYIDSSKLLKDKAETIEHIVEMLDSSVGNYILPGLSSYLLTNGVVRLFHATRNNEGFVTPHSHKFNFTCYVLQGKVTNTIYTPCNVILPSTSSFIEKEQTGTYKDSNYSLVTKDIVEYFTKDDIYEEGSWYSMTYNQIHSIKFEKNSLVLFFEGPNVTNKVTILEPYDRLTKTEMNTFRKDSWMFNNN